MKKFFSKLLSRMAITIFLIAVQAAWLLYFFLVLLQSAPWISTTLTIASLFLIVYIINKNENPAYKMGWLILVALLPILGATMYFAFGNKRPARKMRSKLQTELEITRPLLKQQNDILPKMDSRAASTAEYVSKYGPYPVWQNTDTRYFPVGDDMYEVMLETLENAKHYIFLEYFIIARDGMWEKILEILQRKAAEGLDVRLIYDDMGSIDLLPAKYASKMEKNGIKCLAFNPFVPIVSLAVNHRDHRKIMVIDGHTAFNGGINIADEYINQRDRFGHWKDSGVILHGDAVWNFTLMFLEIWNAFKKTDSNYDVFRPHAHHESAFSGDGFVQPFGDSPFDDEPVAENVYIDILSQAQDYVYIFTPYLIISNELQTALCLASKRGIDVRLVTPGIPDKKIVYRLTRSYYKPLLQAGVKIYEYTPGFLHSKSFVSDDKIAVVGTINMDYRSLYLHFECGTLLYNTKSIISLKNDALNTFAVSREVQEGNCSVGFFGNIINAILRIFAPLL